MKKKINIQNILCSRAEMLILVIPRNVLKCYQHISYLLFFPSFYFCWKREGWFSKQKCLRYMAVFLEKTLRKIKIRNWLVNITSNSALELRRNFNFYLHHRFQYYWLSCWVTLQSHKQNEKDKSAVLLFFFSCKPRSPINITKYKGINLPMYLTSFLLKIFTIFFTLN